jgi:hypothetical protein
MEERFLYHIWDEGHLIPDPRTISGKTIRIVYQGQYNTGRGPDFKNAIIELDGHQSRGDVEIHLKSTDWQAHNHHEDVYYNRVILHVVLKHNSPYELTICEDGKGVEILALEHQLSEDILKLTQEQDIPASPAVFCDLLSAVDKDRLLSILHSAGIRRFESKIKRFNTALALSSFDQIFYEGIFEALGYDKNKLNTMQIAQSLPIPLLREFLADGMSAGELAAIFLGASGLLRKGSALLPKAELQALLESWESQPFFARRLDIDWQLFRIRPQNHPLKRLLYISPIIHASLSQGIFHHFLQQTQDANDLYKAFRAIWQPQTGAGNQLPQSLGNTVQNNIYLNIFLPVLCLWQRKMARESSSVIDAYRKFPALQPNHITRFMERYLNPSQIKLAQSKAIYQQGLMDIYHRYCNWHLCAECKQRATNAELI